MKYLTNHIKEVHSSGFTVFKRKTKSLVRRIIDKTTRIITEMFLIYLFFYTEKVFFNLRHSTGNNNSNQTRVEMSPYGAYDCVLQHLFVAVILARLGLSVKFRWPLGFKLSRLNLFLLNRLGIKIIQSFSVKDVLVFSVDKAIINNNEDWNFPRAFSEKINFILSLLPNNPKIALAAIDSFVRSCKYEHFFESLPFEKGFFLILLHLYYYFENINLEGVYTEKNDYIIMPETPYLDNAMYRHISELQGTKVKILNPHGCYISDLSKDESEFLVSDRRFDMVLDQFVNTDNQTMLRDAEFYKYQRFAGKGRDMDSQAAYKSGGDFYNFELRKVLFLHAVRDANNLTSLKTGIFNTYFEWIEFMAEAIAENNPDGWYIKLHPSSSLYENDEDIVRTVLSRYGLEEKVSELIPQTKVILDMKMPVFTHSGTIALETAALGYKSIVVGSRYANKLVKKVLTYEELYSLVAETNNQNLIEPVSADISKAATIILYNDFGQNTAFDVSPNQSVLPSIDPIYSAINNFKSAVSLIGKLSKKPALDFSLKMAADISRSK